MIEPTKVEADPPEAIGLAQAIANLESVREVVDNPSDLKQFGLAEPQIAVEFKAEGGASGSFKLGNKNATQGEMYALKGGDDTVFLVSAFQESSFNREPFALRDKKILKFDREKADTLALVKGANAIELSRTGSDWRVVKPVASRSDYSAVEGFITRLSSANMSRLVEEDAKDLAKYGLDKPAMTVTIGAGSAKTVLEVGKTENDQTYAKDASRPIVFTVDSTLQTDLNKNFDDYRKKELFEFRPFYLAKMRAVLDAPAGPKTYEIEKVAPAKPGEAGNLEGHARRRSESYGRRRGDGRSAQQARGPQGRVVRRPAPRRPDSTNRRCVVSASFDDGKFERVRFGSVGDNAYAMRDGEAGVAKIETMAMRAAMQAFDLVTIPPSTDPKAEDPKKPEEKK